MQRVKQECAWKNKGQVSASMRAYLKTTQAIVAGLQLSKEQHRALYKVMAYQVPRMFLLNSNVNTTSQDPNKKWHNDFRIKRSLMDKANMMDSCSFIEDMQLRAFSSKNMEVG